MTHPRHDPAMPRAAVAPPQDDDADTEALEDQQTDLHALCEAWARWARTRRLFVKSSLPVSLLGRLRTKGTGRSANGGPDAPCSAALAAFHLAYLAQPMESLDRQVFELHYFWRVRNIKAAAAEIGVSRQHWYRLVRDFRCRVHAGSLEILDVNLAAAKALPHYVTPAGETVTSTGDKKALASM